MNAMKCCPMATGMLLLAAGAWLMPTSFAQEIPKLPIPPSDVDSMRSVWAGKSAVESRLLSDMEDLTRWTHEGVGAIEITDQRSKSGDHSLRLTSPTFTETPSEIGRPPG